MPKHAGSEIDLRYMGSACRYTQVKPRNARGWRRFLPHKRLRRAV